MSLSFVSSNWRRKYPFKSTAAMLDSENGAELPNNVIVACRVSSTLDYSQCYISKVILALGKVSIEFAAGGVILGVANGQHTKDNQTFKINGLQPFFSGFVTLGDSTFVKQASQVFNFTSEAGEIEPSLVTVYEPPAVSALVHNGKKLTGEVKLELLNMDAIVNNETIEFSVINLSEIASRQDFSAELLTCKNPVIGSINGVEPKKESGGNNIDIIGIAPVTITTAAGAIQIGSGAIEISDICKPVVIPPVNEEKEYYADLKTVEEPEWKQWPAFD